MKPKILVMTPVHSIDGVLGILKKTGRVTYLPDPGEREILSRIKGFNALFTNPNKSRVFLSKKLMDAAPGLQVICTASTGTNHIDRGYAAKKGIRVLSLTEERAVINRITSTAEHAFALMMAALRKIPQGWRSVRRGQWDYEPFVGRQVNCLVIGIVGYGRLGKLFSRYARAFGAKVLVYDPYKKVKDKNIRQVGLSGLLKDSDVISFHIHVTPETLGMVGKRWFSRMKPGVILVNTSRGDVMNEGDLIRFLRKNPEAFYATDVLSKETGDKKKNPVLKEALRRDQILITPHVGGMTVEGQRIAYRHAAGMLSRFFQKNSPGRRRS